MIMRLVGVIRPRVRGVLFCARRTRTEQALYDHMRVVEVGEPAGLPDRTVQGRPPVQNVAVVTRLPAGRHRDDENDSYSGWPHTSFTDEKADDYARIFFAFVTPGRKQAPGALRTAS